MQILFGFWLFRLITSLVLLLLSMASPGVPKLNYCLHINIDPDRDIENGLLVRILFTVYTKSLL